AFFGLLYNPAIGFDAHTLYLLICIFEICLLFIRLSGGMQKGN
ncbi:MAG: hypothetical protein ACI8RT_000746, partial [Candidatus Azotimanducaceae bacterium]